MQLFYNWRAGVGVSSTDELDGWIGGCERGGWMGEWMEWITSLHEENSVHASFRPERPCCGIVGSWFRTHTDSVIMMPLCGNLPYVRLPEHEHFVCAWFCGFADRFVFASSTNGTNEPAVQSKGPRCTVLRPQRPPPPPLLASRLGSIHPSVAAGRGRAYGSPPRCRGNKRAARAHCTPTRQRTIPTTDTGITTTAVQFRLHSARRRANTIQASRQSRE